MDQAEDQDRDVAVAPEARTHRQLPKAQHLQPRHQPRQLHPLHQQIQLSRIQLSQILLSRHNWRTRIPQSLQQLLQQRHPQPQHQRRQLQSQAEVPVRGEVAQAAEGLAAVVLEEVALVDEADSDPLRMELTVRFWS